MIDSIRLQNFRSYRDSSFEFEPGVNIIVGPNASGKTNLLEAVLVAATSKSYRGPGGDLLRFGSSWLRLDANFGSSLRILRLILEDEKLIKSYETDGQIYKRIGLAQTVPAVLFEPNHLQLITRGPESRRTYFDDVLERTNSGFKKTAAAYRRALSQRNALLKQTPARAKTQLFAWNVRLAELGAQIVEARLALIEDINKSISRIYGRISGRRTKANINYDSPISLNNYSSRLLSRLEKAAAVDFGRGFTAFGPHREDFIIFLAGRPAAASASRGELRSLLLALKIIELELVETARARRPIFLLDDVFSELDSARRQHLVSYLKNYQSLITTTDADSVIEYFDQHNLISLNIKKANSNRF